MKGIIQCPICGHNHDYKINHQVLAFACSFLNGVIHLPFYSTQDIAEHKKEAEPKTWKNLFSPKKETKEANNVL